MYYQRVSPACITMESMRSVREFLGKLRDSLDPNMRQRVTKLGIVFTVVVVLVGLAAFASANNLLFLLFAALLSIMLISGFVSRLGLAGLELNLEIPAHIAARRPVRVRLVLRNRKWVTPSFSLRLAGATESGLRTPIYIPWLPPRTTLSHPVELLFNERGHHRSNVFWFESGFPFGFTHRRAQVRLEHELLVYPCIDPQPAFDLAISEITGEIDARQRGRGADFYRIRPYIAMETARHVDWKTTAHTGELQVREFASEQDQTITLFLDLHLPQDANHDWFELAVDCCACLVWHWNDRGLRVRVLTQRFDRRIPEEVTVYDVLRYLALVEPLFGARLLTPDDSDLAIAVTARLDDAVAEGWLGPRLPDPREYVRMGPESD